MADVAHDAPASPKAGDIAPQQASRPDSPDRGKLRVFISYSRDDADFADQLDAALDAYGFESSIDRHSVSGGEEWKRRLGDLISEADTVVFVLTPTSARSPICSWEVEEATRLGKRILPVNCRPLEGASPPSQLGERNYIFFYDNPKEPGSGFGTGLVKLVAALNTDFDWLREHTRYLQRATEWERGGRPANRLLSSDDIAEAKAWAASRPKSAPEPTPLHLDFIRASEEEVEARSSAQRKQLEAMNSIIMRFIEGISGQKDIDIKKDIFAVWQSGADQGDTNSMCNLGLLYAYAEGDYAKAREWCEKAAAKDSADAMFNLGLFYANGQGVAMDDAKAREWYEKAADKGNADAMFNLGVRYNFGHGVAQDYAKACEWYEKAADKGNAGAMFDLGLLYNFGHGVAQDYAKACEWYEKAADKGNANAMRILGELYNFGHGVAQDYAKAREWYEKAADKGNADAMFNLGVLYNFGHGVAQDYAKACEWYEKAADKGNEGAMRILGELYANGQGVAQDYAKAREWYEKAADEGNANAMFNLGLLYANGWGVAQDYAKAREWYEKAADKGNAGAKANLEQLPIREAAGAGRYAEALHLQEALAAKVETKREGKPGKETADALVGVAWYALFAREFRKALSAANRAHALVPDDLAIETNWAHALMFLERGKQSKALYLAHKGKPVSGQDGKLWERVIAEDFAEFRKAGLTHPMMADIEKELGVSP